MNKPVFIIIAALLLNSCNNSLDPNYFDVICKDSKEFKVDSSRVHYVTSVNHDYLSLKSIAVPSDTFFMRIEYSTDTTLKIFEYSFYKLKPSYKIYTFPVDYDGKILFDKANDTLTKFVQNIEAADIDRDFINNLKEKHILDLNSSSLINGYPVDWDRSYVIEYSYRCHYNIVLFTDPYQNSKHFKEARFLVDFLEYLKQQFGF